MHINPIEKHKSEIEKRISQLEQKFNKEKGGQSNVIGKRAREYVQDQNKVYSNPGLSKTMELKGKNRVGQIARVKKNIPPNIQNEDHNQILNELKLTANLYQRQAKQQKDQKIKDLEHMVKSLLQGQKVLEKELNQLKNKNLKDQISKAKQTEQSYNQLEPQASVVQRSIDKSMNRNQTTKDSSVIRKRSSVNPINQSMLIVEGLNQGKNVSKQKKNSKKGPIGSKKKDFQQLYEQLKQKHRDDKRYFVQEQWKSRIWNEVESRVRQSDKQYKDTMHRNNKHQFQHLMNTFELQRKLKDDLIDKVYQQCNDQFYK